MTAVGPRRLASARAVDPPVPPGLTAVPSRSLTRADLMTAADVADLVRVPVSTVREWGRNGTLPRIKLGRHVRFIRAQVEATIFASRETPRSRVVTGPFGETAVLR
jgi:excisionase family DNA binding protein